MRRKDIGGRGPCKPPTQGENLMFKTLRTALFGMGAFLLAGGLLAVPAQASDYPNKPIQLVPLRRGRRLGPDGPRVG